MLELYLENQQIQDIPKAMIVMSASLQTIASCLAVHNTPPFPTKARQYQSTVTGWTPAAAASYSVIRGKVLRDRTRSWVIVPIPLLITTFTGAPTGRLWDICPVVAVRGRKGRLITTLICHADRGWDGEWLLEGLEPVVMDERRTGL